MGDEGPRLGLLRWVEIANMHPLRNSCSNSDTLTGRLASSFVDWRAWSRLVFSGIFFDRENQQAVLRKVLVIHKCIIISSLLHIYDSRYKNYLRPDICNDSWTKEEDLAILTGQSVVGNKWTEMWDSHLWISRMSIFFNDRFRISQSQSLAGKVQSNERCEVSNINSEHSIVTGPATQ